MSGRTSPTRRFILPGLALGLAAPLAASWVVGTMLVRPASHHPQRPQGWDAEEVTIATSDGVKLAGWYAPGARPDSPGVLLLHGNGASRLMFTQRQRFLRDMGYATLAIDLRGHGASTSRPRSFGLHEARDAGAAFAWLARRQGGARLAVIGISLGGAAALLGEAGPLPAKALVLEAVYPDIGRAIRNRLTAHLGPVGMLVEPLLSYQSLPRYSVYPQAIAPVAAISRYHGRLLVVGGGADRYTPPGETQELFAAANEPKALWLAPDIDHVEVGRLNSDAYRARLSNFLREALGSGA